MGSTAQAIERGAPKTRRLDKLGGGHLRSLPIAADSLAYATKVCQTLVTSREFRLEVRRTLVRLYETTAAETDHLNACQCLMFLDDADGVAADPRRARGRERGGAASGVPDRVLAARERDPGVSQHA